jgi:hypothetical protein
VKVNSWYEEKQQGVSMQRLDSNEGFCYVFEEFTGAGTSSRRRLTMEDTRVLQHIKKLTEEEEILYSRGNLNDKELTQLHQMKIELDQCWDLLRQRQALREAGKNPAQAKVRPPDIVENYEQ